MIQGESEALAQALALMRAPRGPRPGPEQRLPQGVLWLLRIVSGDEEALTAAQGATQENPATLREAASFYLQQVLFAPGASSFRILGVNPDENDETLREHYRRLARWLHPDRNPDDWEAVFAERVNLAWRDLRTADRRARYEQELREHTDDWSTVMNANPPPVVRPPPRPEADVPGTPHRDLRWVPSAVIATLASVALVLVVMFYAQRAPREAETPVAIVDVPEALRTPVLVQEPPIPTPQPNPAVAQSVVETPLAEVEAEPIAAAIALAEPVTPAPPAPSPVPPPVRAPVRPVAVVTQPLPAPARPTPRPPRVAKPASTAASRPAATELAAVPAMDTRRPAAVETPPPPESAFGARDANRMLGNLSQAYERGDLRQMRALFAADARGPRGGLDSIIDDYRRVFSDSRERSLAVRDVSWFVSGDTITVVASFEATVTSGRGRERRTHGDLRLDLRREGDQLQIYRIRHDERSG